MKLLISRCIKLSQRHQARIILPSHAAQPYMQARYDGGVRLPCMPCMLQGLSVAWPQTSHSLIMCVHSSHQTARWEIAGVVYSFSWGTGGLTGQSTVVCRLHAASVLHMSHMLAHCQNGLRDAGIVEDMLEYSMYMAAICHDYEHPGLTNDFLIKSHHPLAMCYNDR